MPILFSNTDNKIKSLKLCDVGKEITSIVSLTLVAKVLQEKKKHLGAI